METGYARLTVYFEDPFWVGLFLRGGGGTWEACKVTFGPEPKDYEVYAFLLENWRSLRFSPPVAAKGPPERKVSPKRARREARLLQHGAHGAVEEAGDGQVQHGRGSFLSLCGR